MRDFENFYDTFMKKTDLKGTKNYFSPILRRKSDITNCWIVSHDPFKSDIYSLGLAILSAELYRQGQVFSTR